MSTSASIPPHSVEAEQSVLGSLLIDPTAFDEVVTHISANDFYFPENALIFQAIVAMSENNQPVDVITLGEYLGQKKQLETINGVTYLLSLAKNTLSSTNANAYAQIVAEKALLRKLIATSLEINKTVFNSDLTPMAQLEQAEQNILAIGEGRAKAGETQTTTTVASAFVKRLGDQFASGNALIGLSSGYAELDKLTKGLRPSQLIVVAGRPSMGKTTFALNIAQHIGLSQNKKVLIFSIEQPAIELMSRFVASISNISGQNLDAANLTARDWEKVTDALGQINEQGNFIFEESQNINPLQCRAIARRIKRAHPNLGLIIIDYVQLMSLPGRHENRTQEIASISRGLKLLAREMNVPVILVSQLNRELERRTNKRPVLSDLRDSGAIEQDADLVIFLHREKYYDKENQDIDDHLAEIIVAKNRHGPLGTIELEFQGEFFRFVAKKPALVQW